MELTRICFESYRSLHRKKLDLNSNCLGLVGINESGKSNILRAVKVLNIDEKLSYLDVPKMGGLRENPEIRYSIALSTQESKRLKHVLVDWMKSHSPVRDIFEDQQFNLEYQVEYDVEEKKP